MSGRDVVRALRENTDLNKGRGWGSLPDLALGLVALVAVICCAALAVNTFLLRGPSPGPVAVAGTGMAQPAWDAGDDTTCQNRARAARATGDDDRFPLANDAVTGGYAALAANLECHASVKVARLCDSGEKAALIAQIENYLTRRDLIVLGLDAQGAPMQLMGSIMGGEAAFGSSVYDMTKADTLAFMDLQHQRVVESLRKLARGGILSPGDFGFLGYGAPAAIGEILRDITVTNPICD